MPTTKIFISFLCLIFSHFLKFNFYPIKYIFSLFANLKRESVKIVKRQGNFFKYLRQEKYFENDFLIVIKLFGEFPN